MSRRRRSQNWVEKLMLRITIHNEDTTIRFEIEGKLAGPWVEELKKCWLAALYDEPCLPLLVDLSAVTFIDLEAKTLLTEMSRHGARLTAIGLMNQAIIEEIASSK